MEELHAKYVEKFGKKVPVNKKNDAEWIEKKVAAEEVTEAEVNHAEAIEEVVTEPVIIPEFDDYFKLQSFHGFTNVETTEPKVLQARYNLTDSDMKLVNAFNEITVAEMAKPFVTKGKMPDYIIPIIDKYGLIIQDFYDDVALEKKVMFGAKDEADKATRQAEIKQIKHYSLVIKWPIKW